MIATISPVLLADLRRTRGTVTLSDVRIAVGALVVVGAAVAAFGPESPMNWKAIGAGLAGFVGCGLVFAGVTDTCGMAMLIARMPWNQSSGGACRTATTCSRAVLLALVLGTDSGIAFAEHTKDSLDTVKQAIAQQKAVLIDVREPEEWQEGHVAGAGLLPLSSLEKGMSAQDIAKVLPKDKIIYCHCLAGGRCQQAAAILKPLGYDVRALKPGYPQLVKAGFPAVFGK